MFWRRGRKNLHSCSYERGVRERLDPWAFHFISSPLPRCGRERSSSFKGHPESSQGHPITVLHFYCLVSVLYESALRVWGEQKHLWAVPGQHLVCGLGQMERTTKNKIFLSSTLWLEHTQKGSGWWSGDTTFCVLGAPAATLGEILEVEGLLALISEAICLLYDFLCLYDLFFAFWPHCDTVAEFAVPKSLSNRLCGLPVSQLPVFVLVYIWNTFLMFNTDWLA